MSEAPTAASVASAPAGGIRLGAFGRYALPAAAAVAICAAGAAASGLHSGFPTNWVLGVPNWFDRLDNWVTDNQSSNFFLKTIIGGFGNFLSGTTNDVVNALHWMTWVGVLGVSTLVVGSSAGGAPPSSQG